MVPARLCNKFFKCTLWNRSKETLERFDQHHNSCIGKITTIYFWSYKRYIYIGYICQRHGPNAVLDLFLWCTPRFRTVWWSCRSWTWGSCSRRSWRTRSGLTGVSWQRLSRGSFPTSDLILITSFIWCQFRRRFWHRWQCTCVVVQGLFNLHGLHGKCVNSIRMWLCSCMVQTFGDGRTLKRIRQNEIYDDLWQPQIIVIFQHRLSFIIQYICGSSPMIHVPTTNPQLLKLPLWQLQLDVVEQPWLLPSVLEAWCMAEYIW